MPGCSCIYMVSENEILVYHIAVDDSNRSRPTYWCRKITFSTTKNSDNHFKQLLGRADVLMGSLLFYVYSCMLSETRFTACYYAALINAEEN